MNLVKFIFVDFAKFVPILRKIYSKFRHFYEKFYIQLKNKRVNLVLYMCGFSKVALNLCALKIIKKCKTQIISTI